MKKLLLLLFLFGIASGQTNLQYFENSSYLGGLNVKTDSASLKPTEALVLDNLVFDKFGSLQKRSAIKYWNANQLPSGEIVKDIYDFTTQAGTDKKLIATQYFAYAKNNSDTTTVATWTSNRIGYSRGVMRISYQHDTAYGDTTWWLLGIKKGDYLFFRESTYVIDSILTDSTLKLNKNGYWNDAVKATYKIWRYLPSANTQITSWNNNAYFACDEVPPFYYDSSQCRWLACVDTGTMQDYFWSTNHYQRLFPTTGGYIQLDYNRHAVYGWPIYMDYVRVVAVGNNSTYDTLAHMMIDSLSVGRPVYMIHPYRGPIGGHSNPTGATVTRKIISFIDSLPAGYQWRFRFSDGDDRTWTGGAFYETTGCYANMGYAGNGFDTMAVTDTNKNFSNASLSGLTIIFGSSPYRPYKILGAGGTDLHLTVIDTFGYDTNKVVGRYYIFDGVPFSNYTTYQKDLRAPIFKQIQFHDNVLYAFGCQFDSTGDTINQGFIYHSDIGLPKQFRSISRDGLTQQVCGFDLSLNSKETPTSMFELHDRLVITTGSKIYELTGYPQALGDGALVNVMPNFGIPSYNAVVTRDNNYAYMANANGFYKFNGNDVEKISLQVEPLINSYKTTDYELSYFKDYVYFSFNDSNYTLAYYEPTQTFSRLLFGIESASHQATDSSYFWFAHHTLGSRRLFKYPMENVYFDNLAPADSSSINIRYKTGWLSLDNLQWEKQMKLFTSVIAKSTDTLVYKFRADFDTLATITDSTFEAACATCGSRFINKTRFSTPLRGRYFQWEVSGSSKKYFSLGTWGFQWVPFSRY